MIKVFNTSNGECVHELQGHSKQVTGVVLSKSNDLQVRCGDGSFNSVNQSVEDSIYLLNR